MKHTCIYWKQEKEESEFNIEHVIPRQFGTYDTNATVLNRFQVCRSCNTAFSHELENIVGMDSIEAISRIQLRKRPMTDGRTLLGKRMKVEIADPRFNGISPKVVINSSNSERIELVYGKLIGIHKDSEDHDCI